MTNKQAKSLKPGTRVKTVAGCSRTGIIIHRFDWTKSTDGTYRQPDANYVPTLWDDGTKGYSAPAWLALEGPAVRHTLNVMRADSEQRADLEAKPAPREGYTYHEFMPVAY